jgi:hypothetical protein
MLENAFFSTALEQQMISLTRREFDTVSSALLKALADGQRREPVPAQGGRARTVSRLDPARANPRRRAVHLVDAVH